MTFTFKDITDSVIERTLFSSQYNQKQGKSRPVGFWIDNLIPLRKTQFTDKREIVGGLLQLSWDIILKNKLKNLGSK